MKRLQLRFYTRELQEHHMVFVYEWLLMLANRLGIRLGTAIRAVAGYGLLAGIHEFHTVDLTIDCPILVDFIVSPEEAEKLLTLIAAEDLQLPFTQHAVEYGEVGSSVELEP